MSDLKPALVTICQSCVRKNTGLMPAEFLEQTRARLVEAEPARTWTVEPSPCMRVCPRDRLSMTVRAEGTRSEAGRLSLSREASLDSVINEALSLTRPPRAT